MLTRQIAFYFAFTQSYFTALIGVSILGASAWTILGNFSPVYGLVNTLLCVAFVEYWKFQEEDLAIRWGVKGVSKIETKRHEFDPEKTITDPITGEEMGWFPGPKRFQRQLLQLPFAMAAALGLGTLIAMCFGIEIFVSEVYKGPGQSILVSHGQSVGAISHSRWLGLPPHWDHHHGTALAPRAAHRLCRTSDSL